MDESNLVFIKDLMKETEQYLLSQGYKKGTLGTYKATWNKFVAFSDSKYYSRVKAEEFLRCYFGVDAHSAEQKLDMRMRHALRHMNSLEDYLTSKTVSRRKMRSRIGRIDFDLQRYSLFFAPYLTHCKQQHYSASWFSNTERAFRLFLTALDDTGVDSVSKINAETIERFAVLILNHKNFCPNTRYVRTKAVSAYLKWLYKHGQISKDYSNLLPNIKRTPPPLPDVWSEEDIQKMLDAIDVSSPVGKRNYAMFLLLARTGLRISDVVLLRFENIDWKKNCIRIVQQKTGNPLSVPLSAEIGEAIISYLKYGRPESKEDVVFLSHNAPFQPLHIHNNFNPEIRMYMRLAGVDFTDNRHAGVHTIRSSFATNMLKQGASLESISNILGHSSIRVATSYLRVDVEHLRHCALGLEVVK